MTITIEKNSNCENIYVKYYTIGKMLYLSINDDEYEIFNYVFIKKKDDFITFKYMNYDCELLFDGSNYILNIKKFKEIQ